MRSIRSYHAESFVLKMFADRVNNIIKKGLSVIRLVGLLIGSNSFTVNILTTGVLSMVAWMLRIQTLTVADVFLYPFYIADSDLSYDDRPQSISE